VTKFLWFSSVPPRKFRESVKIRSRPLPSTAFPIHRSFIALSFNARIIRDTEKAPLNKQPTKTLSIVTISDTVDHRTMSKIIRMFF
jgi:hypothetical protein